MNQLSLFPSEIITTAAPVTVIWNPWHGCTKYSEGCLNCYVYRMDEKYNKDPKDIKVTQSFNLPLKKYKNGTYK